MSSLTIEMGLRRNKRSNSPPVPDQIKSRDDVTVAQKQRLAVLAKMGLGHVSGASSAPPVRDAPQMQLREYRGVQATDRKAELLERERRFREQEERQQEQDAQEEQERRAKRAKAQGGGGISRLGPVQPREDDIPQFLPAPMQVPPPKPAMKGGTMAIKISKETADRAKGPQPEKPAEKEEEEEDDEETKAEDQVLAFLRMEKAKRAKAKAAAQPPAPKPAKKKKKRKTKEGEEWVAAGGDDEAAGAGAGDEEGYEEYEPAAPPLPRVAQNTGFGKSFMVVESVKGKVSTANRNMTDVDLERRFAMQESQGGHGGLMTEEEVLRMIRKEKQEKGTQAGSASRRVQRELAEWAAAKEQQRARVKSPHRFERMVVARK